MNILKNILIISLGIFLNSAWAASPAVENYNTMKMLKGDWKLAPANEQEGGATKKGPAAKLLGTNKTAMSFKVIGKGSTIQENLLPGTGKEMATMYHCDKFKNCTQLQAKHYCAKKNQPELLLDASASAERKVSLICDKRFPLCNSKEGHVHGITHKLSQDNNRLTTTYAIFKNGKFKKNTIYHFVRK